MNIKEVALKAGLAENAIYKWTNMSPKHENLKKVADVLGVSTDFLNGDTDNPYSNSSAPKPMKIDLIEIVHQDEPNWDEWLSAGGKPLTDRDKALIKAMFYDRSMD